MDEMDINESIEKILNSDQLVTGKFYHRFFNECPHLKMYFEGVDMERQNAMLTAAMVLVETLHTKGGGGLSPYLHVLGKDHEARGISRDDFTDWTESMLRTLADFHGGQWNMALERQWHAAFTKAIHIMLEAYEGEE